MISYIIATTSAVAFGAFCVWMLVVFNKPYLQLRRTDGRTYLTRYKLFNNRWFRIYIHRLDAPDPDRHMHNHPWTGVVLVLWKTGRYVQKVYSGGHRVIEHEVGRLNLLGRWYHMITEIGPGTWTMTIAGPVRPEGWGFLVDGYHMDWEEYVRTIQKEHLSAVGTVSGKRV